MNKMTELAQENEENYARYLKRMTQSINFSTKGLIPWLASRYGRILDVGCGSGVVMDALKALNPSAQIVGIDLNEEAVKQCNAQRPDLDIRYCDIYEMDEKFDCIIFSSVLHEVSSYAQDPALRFTAAPILNMLRKAHSLLKEGGIVIIRDGLAHEGNRKVLLKMSDPNEDRWIERFAAESGAYAHEQVKREGEYWRVSEKFMQEFICTYTWGETSWPREVLEKFGILDEEEWKQTVREAGFGIASCMCALEEYEKYMGDKVVIREGSFPEAFTILLTAKKK